MKNLFKILLPCIIFFASMNFAKGGDSTHIFPTYQLRVTNYSFTPESFEFDIYLKHTNPHETNFELAGHQYFFRINPELANGGTFTYRYVTDINGDTLSDLPFRFRPRNPSTAGNLLRLATNSLQGAGNGLPIDTAGLGMRVLRMRVGTTAGAFTTNVAYYFELLDTLAQGSAFFTKINAYTGLNNTVNSQISYRMYNIVDSTPTGINNGSPISSIIPKEFELSQNYPNPFNPVTKIQYALPVSGNVQLKIFDMTGREIANLVNEVKPAGNYSVNFNGADFASGVYFYRIDVTGEKEYKSVKRMVLIK
ncbi:MAG: T9SS type A sorting domain-containing protein [Ignavibacteria bacterium]|nr:T9SS type A sorting domain-containing protein [Ignavibacteria bacterium]